MSAHATASKSSENLANFANVDETLNLLHVLRLEIWQKKVVSVSALFCQFVWVTDDLNKTSGILE